ncbi:islet amyloid polypeptide isoform X1 [Ursus arctos]|uniref:islet amyloid polypeptide isoform X1 n=1 Tax=Ursus arctos TaxID=9644 RepID=UPI001CF84866|nr:islet amyloid polypeptide isoform X1 [Ursus arctos]
MLGFCCGSFLCLMFSLKNTGDLKHVLLGSDDKSASKETEVQWIGINQIIINRSLPKKNCSAHFFWSGENYVSLRLMKTCQVPQASVSLKALTSVLPCTSFPAQRINFCPSVSALQGLESNTLA